MSDATIEQPPDVSRLPLGQRVRAYLSYTGPGYLQSAMTLGGGSVASCAALGSLFGYKYLWVQLVAMGLGFCVLASVAKQTCHSQKRAYQVFWDELHPIFAILWAVSAFVATILWHIPQYSLTANGVITLAEGVSVDLESTPARLAVGLVVLGVAAFVVRLYHRGASGLKAYERVVKFLVWAVVISFAVVVLSAVGSIEWSRLFLGLFGITFIQDLVSSGVEDAAVKPVIGALAAAVGINMLFLYPYSLQQKGWGPKQKELAYFDLLSGMALPFIIATGLMIVAVGHTIGPEPGVVGEEVRDIRQIIPVLEPTFGGGLARIVIGLGIIAIGFSTIITHMLAVGFIGCEMFGLQDNPNARWWFSLVPAVGVFGAIAKFPIPLAITASTLAMPLMPVAVACFLVLLNRRSYMGDEMPSGVTRLVWNVVLTVAIALMSGAAVIALQRNWASLQDLI